MKKIFNTFFLLVAIVTTAIAQDNSENYVKTTTYRVPVNAEDEADADQKIELVNYFDGLGRAKQTVNVQAGGQKQNIVQYFEYDALGRSPREYLPFATEGLVPDPYGIMEKEALKTAISDFYNTAKYENTLNPFNEVRYEASPLSRLVEQGAAGNSWKVEIDSDEDHTIKYHYESNQANEVRYFSVDFIGGNTANPRLVYEGFYVAGELYKNITKNENWTPASGSDHTSQEFTNKEGQVVLKRDFNNNTPHDTYYVYDRFGNLTFALSPEASSQIVVGAVLAGNYNEILDKQGYRYKYDHRNRLIEKKIAGKGWEHIVYNRLDQPVLTQDANQRSKSPREWLFTKYDELGRVAYTGIKRANISRATFQNILNNGTNELFEERTDNPVTLGGTSLYYGSAAVPTVVDEILTVNYYDTYPADVSVPVSNFYGIPTTENTDVTVSSQGLPTVTEVKVLGTNHWVTTVTAYDEKGRSIYVRTENPYLETGLVVESLLDFTGNVLESKTFHEKQGTPSITTFDYFTYDHQSRLASHRQKVNEEPLQLLSESEYDELGLLSTKKVGGQTTYAGYKDFVRVSIDADGTIRKEAPQHSWNAGLITRGEITEDGGVKFTVPHDAFRYYRVGLVRSVGASTNRKHFNYGIYIRADDTDSNGFSDVQVIINSINPLPQTWDYVAGDKFSVERSGNQILFKKNGAVFYSTTADNHDYVGKVSLFSNNAQVDDFKLFGDYIGSSLQKVDYAYNVRGWLTDINNVDIQGNARDEDNDLFHFRINYDGDIEGTASADPLYDGNISQTIWKSANDDQDKRTYGYRYDGLNRIVLASGRKGDALNVNAGFTVSNISYDRNGNILTLNRNGSNGTGTADGQWDALNYAYDGNQLTRVTDNSGSPSHKNYGFYDGHVVGTIDYEYDENGNMVLDRNKGIENVSYNHLNLAQEIEVDGIGADGQVVGGVISYVYDANGAKLSKSILDNVHGTSTIISYSDGGYIYQSQNGVEGLRMIVHPEGYLEPIYTGKTTSTTKSFTKTSLSNDPVITGFRYAFQYDDHLGNVRLTYMDTDGDGRISSDTEIVSEQHYYPFGLRQKGYNANTNASTNAIGQKFMFNGKEFEHALGLGLYEYGSRMYDPAIALFTSVDPKAEEFKFQSPYVYAANNPVYYEEKDGENPVRAAITAFKIARKAYKAYKKLKKAGEKFTAKHLKNIGLDEIVDIAGDLATIFGSDASAWDRIGAVADLVLGTSFNNKGQKVVKKALGFADEAKDAKKTAVNVKKVVSETKDAQKDLRKTRKQINKSKTNVEKASDQFEEITKAQEQAKKAKKGSKQNSINSTKKSKQNDKHNLKRIDLDDLDEFQ